MNMSIELLDEPTTALTLSQRAAVALGSDKARKDLTELVLKSKDVLAINSAAGREECHSYAMALVRARTAISKTSKEARDDATKFSKAVIAEEAELIKITEPEEKRLMALRDGYDQKIAAEKAAKAAAEQARIDAITERIAGITMYVALALDCRTSERIQALKDKLSAMVLTVEDFQEFLPGATDALQYASDRVNSLLATKKAEEAERAAARAEAERLAAVKKEQEAEALKLAKERADLEALRKSIETAKAVEAPKPDPAPVAVQQPVEEDPALVAYREAITVKPEPVTNPVGEVLSMEIEPERPSDIDMVKAVAAAFNTDYVTALAWMESIDFHELNR